MREIKFWRAFLGLVVVLAAYDACVPEDDESPTDVSRLVVVTTTATPTVETRFCGAMEAAYAWESEDHSAYVAEGWSDEEWHRYESLVNSYIRSIPPEYTADVVALRSGLSPYRVIDPPGMTPAEVAAVQSAADAGAQRFASYGFDTCSSSPEETVGVISTYDSRRDDRTEAIEICHEQGLLDC